MPTLVDIRNFLACFCIQLPKSFPHVNARPGAVRRCDYVQPDGSDAAYLALECLLEIELLRFERVLAPCGHELALVSLAENRPRRCRADNQIGDKQDQQRT